MDTERLEPDSLPLGERISLGEGVSVERRSFFTLAACAIAAGSAGARTPPRFDTGEATRLSYDEFLKEVVPLARQLVTDTSALGEDRYQHTLASLAVRLADVPIPEMKQNGAGDGPHTFIGANEGGDPFVVLHWRMEPRSVISTHPHLYGNVVTLGLEGETRIVNYEAEGQLDTSTTEPFRLRRVQDQLLRPGRINLVAIAHGNFHGFEAGPEGARGLDITTRIRPKVPTPGLVISPEPVDAVRRIHEARWTA
jgi:hypothetical protein